MSISINQVDAGAIEQLVPLLMLAEPSERGLRWGLAHLVDAVYHMTDDSIVLAAATLQWRNDPAEIMELAVDPAHQGRGLGKRFVAWICDEARRRGKRKVLVGTSNASLNNIAFYQKCGFHMDHVRQNYFRYYREPIYENGIEVRDLLVFARDL